MILQRLVEYYDRKRTDLTDPIPSFGLGREKISFELVIDPSGKAHELNDLRIASPSNAKTGKSELRSRWVTVPYRGDRSSDVKANFLWDNTGYVFGRAGTEIDEKKRGAFLKLHWEVLDKTSDPILRVIVDFLQDWDPSRFDKFALAAEALDQNVVFRMKGSRSFVHDSPSLQLAWADYFRNDIGQRRGFDLVSGAAAAVTVKHFMIQGVSGAQPTGASLSSFNDSAYTSYGLESSYNSPVSVDNTFKYSTALRELLLYDRRKLIIGEDTVTWWAERQTPLEGFISDIWAENTLPASPTPEDLRRAQEVRLFLSQLREGYSADDAVRDTDTTRFFVLGLAAPAKSRLSVRFWEDTTVGEMKARLGQHMSDVELYGARDGDPPLMIRRIVRATGRASFTNGKFKGYDTKSNAPILSAAISRAVLTGTPYPRLLLTALVRRLRSDREVRHDRIAAIKACVLREFRSRGQSMSVPVRLDAKWLPPAYQLGRLFAALVRAHEDAYDHRIQTSIKDRFIASASSTPSIAFPQLLSLNRHHLNKLPEDVSSAKQRKVQLRQTHERRIIEIINLLRGFPDHLSILEQGLFFIAYYQQMQPSVRYVEMVETLTDIGAKHE